MQYPIRKLTIDDYNAIIDLWERAGLSHRPKGRDSLKAMTPEMERAETVFLGMFDSDKIIGVVMASSDGRKGWINRLAIDPDYRRQGLAGLLIKESELFLYSLGIKVIAALIEGNNQPSESTFANSGYVYADDVKYYSKRLAPED